MTVAIKKKPKGVETLMDIADIKTYKDGRILFITPGHYYTTMQLEEIKEIQIIP